MASFLGFGMLVLLLLLLLPPAAVLAEGSDHGLVAFLVSVQSAAERLAEANEVFDPKPYVDRPLKKDLPVAQSAFQVLSRSNNGSVGKDEFSNFLREYFEEPGRDLAKYNISGFEKHPPGFLPGVADPTARGFALDVHSIWKLLSRKVTPDVTEKPLRHSLLPLPGAVVVPGARFREVYYWDSYWIVRGLLVSKLYDTATSLVGNLIYLINTYGFVPNGARLYYINRSQPPLLSEMVKEIYLATNNTALIKHAFPALLKEHQFWSSDRHSVHIRDEHGTTHLLTRYNANWYKPRPESHTVDVKTCQGIRDPKQKAEHYHQIATAAETGWDFSSRWMGNRQNLTTLKTSFILPVDLNGFLFQMEKNIAYFARLLKKGDTERQYEKLAESRRVAMNSILWNEELKQYLDYWLVARNATLSANLTRSTYEFHKQNQNTDVFPSNFFPLWCGVVSPGDDKVPKLVSSFQTSGLLLPGGVVTSLTQTQVQWDYPNAWPPIQHIMIEGLAASKTKEGLALAKTISQRWLNSNYGFYEKQQVMLEKYDARFCGKPGSGGEYRTAQAGFGWSNGVVLSLFDTFGWGNTKLSC